MVQIPKQLLDQSASYESFNGYTSTGTSYAKPIECKVAIEPKRRKVVNTNGTEIISNALAVFHPSNKIKEGDRVTYNGNTYTVIEALPLSIKGQIHHIEAVLQ